MSLFHSLVIDRKPAVAGAPEYPPLPFAYREGVGESEDLRRILALPRRQPPSVSALPDFRNLETEPHDCACHTMGRPCCNQLRPVQRWALSEIQQHERLLGIIGVGHGKSALDLLAPMVLKDCKRAVLLVPPSLKQKVLDLDAPYYGQHWKLPNISGGRWLTPGRPTLYVVAFSELSGGKASDLLDRLSPDAIVIDEAHCLKDQKAARTRRFLHYLKHHPDVRVLAWSGTMTSRSICDYAHLLKHGFHAASPLPLHTPVLDEWAKCLDGGVIFGAEPGNLMHLCKPGENVRQGFRRRLLETPGVVSSNDAEGCQASITFTTRPLKATPVVKEHLARLGKLAERPDGEPLVDAMQVAECARQLSCGFYYRWRFPQSPPRELVDSWFEARKDWLREVREKLKHARPHMDSPGLLQNAAKRHAEGYSGPLPVWESETWAAWSATKDKVEHVTEAVWFDRTLVEDVAKWLAEKPGLAWYDFTAIGEALHALGVRVIGSGTHGNLAANALKGGEHVAISISAHGTGKDLQCFSRNLLVNPPSSGAIMEQLMGRTHRPGQRADEVTWHVYRHTGAMRDAMEKARDLAEYIQDSSGAVQKLVDRATYDW